MLTRRLGAACRVATFFVAVAASAGATTVLTAAAAVAADAATHETAGAITAAAAPGATVDELLSMARAMNPAVAAAALDSEAARARVDAAGRLPNPSFSSEFRDISRQRGTALPDELARVEYKIAQEFPLWGKRRLAEDVARAQAGAAAQQQRATEFEIAARIKVVFATYYAAFESARLTSDLRATVATLAEVTHSRYALGFGEQEDVIRAEVEKTRLRTELVRFAADQRQTAGQLNALLDRREDAALARPAALRPLPAEVLNLEALLARARAGNPAIGTAEAQIAEATGTAALVHRSWYPDVSLGVTFQQFVDQPGRSPGYEAMLGTTIPLQWGLTQAREREAKASLAAAQRRRDAADAQLRGDLADAFWALDGSRRVAELLEEAQLPQSRLAFQAALRGYEQGRTTLDTVLDTEQRVYETMLRLLAVHVEQQARLAEIERLIGSDL